MKNFMKDFQRVALSAALLAGLPLAATAQDQPPPVKATAVSLEIKLDTKVAKAGDVFAVRLLQDATMGATKLPSGSRLMGKIVDAKSGTLVLLFDSVQIKKADPVPAHAALAAVAEAYDANATGMAHGADPMSGMGSSPTGDPLAMTAAGSSIKGITLETGKTTETSGTLTSAKDFKLDKGTRMWVGIF